MSDFSIASSSLVGQGILDTRRPPSPAPIPTAWIVVGSFFLALGVGSIVVAASMRSLAGMRVNLIGAGMGVIVTGSALLLFQRCWGNPPKVKLSVEYPTSAPSSLRGQLRRLDRPPSPLETSIAQPLHDTIIIGRPIQVRGDNMEAIWSCYAVSQALEKGQSLISVSQLDSLLLAGRQRIERIPLRLDCQPCEAMANVEAPTDLFARLPYPGSLDPSCVANNSGMESIDGMVDRLQRDCIQAGSARFTLIQRGAHWGLIGMQPRGRCNLFLLQRNGAEFVPALRDLENTAALSVCLKSQTLFSRPTYEEYLIPSVDSSSSSNKMTRGEFELLVQRVLRGETAQNDFTLLTPATLTQLMVFHSWTVGDRGPQIASVQTRAPELRKPSTDIILPGILEKTSEKATDGRPARVASRPASSTDGLSAVATVPQVVQKPQTDVLPAMPQAIQPSMTGGLAIVATVPQVTQKPQTVEAFSAELVQATRTQPKDANLIVSWRLCCEAGKRLLEGGALATPAALDNIVTIVAGFEPPENVINDYLYDPMYVVRQRGRYTQVFREWDRYGEDDRYCGHGVTGKGDHYCGQGVADPSYAVIGSHAVHNIYDTVEEIVRVTQFKQHLTLTFVQRNGQCGLIAMHPNKTSGLFSLDYDPATRTMRPTAIGFKNDRALIQHLVLASKLMHPRIEEYRDLGASQSQGLDLANGAWMREVNTAIEEARKGSNEGRAALRAKLGDYHAYHLFSFSYHMVEARSNS